MSTQLLLPELEKTVNELVLELLLIDSEDRHSELIYAKSEDRQALRITMHYVMALLAYGFQLQDPELKRALLYFDKPFPRKPGDFMNASEINRLMVLLYLAPRKASVDTRLRQLVRQQSNGYFDIQPGWQAYDTLWALENLVLARKQGVLSESIITTENLQYHLNTILNRHEMKRDKDLALALGLQYKLYGRLQPEHEALLREMLAFSEQNKGMWGMREFEWRMPQMRWFQSMVEGRSLTYDMVKGDSDDDNPENNFKFFRKIIISTCMMVEYLSPLMDDYPEVRESLTRGLQTWWGQFKGRNTLTTLRELFPKPNDYEYLLVLSRTIRAVSAYVQQPLRQLDPVFLLRELAKIKTNLSESPEARNLKQAVRHWVHIDMIGAVEQLKLGFSEANVVRVYPYIGSPLTDDDEQGSWINHSLVVKYGPDEAISSERRHYEKLPSAIRDYFVRIPDAVYTDPDANLTYVVMQDLKNYRTLYEVYSAVARQVNEVGDQLGNFLCRMHEGGSSVVKKAEPALLRDMYLGKMLEHIDRVFNFVYDNHLFEHQSITHEIQYELFDCLGTIIQRQKMLENFPAACMHGDLHLRNIMVRGLDNTHGRHNIGMTFKLIDLEFFHIEGDAAFDAGELMIDLDLVAHEGEKLEYHGEMMKLCDLIQQRYQTFRNQRGDEMFDTRVELAKARALLRIAKGKTKRGQRYIKTEQHSQAQQIAEQVVTHATAALGYLRNVVNTVQ